MRLTQTSTIIRLLLSNRLGAIASNFTDATQIDIASSIPDVVDSYGCTKAPCVAFCSPDNVACVQAVEAMVATCEPEWVAYRQMSSTATSAPPGWLTVVTVQGPGPSTSTALNTVWTTFSTANDVFTKQDPASRGGSTTFTVVYAVGSPSLVPTTTTLKDYRFTRTRFEGPRPTCRYTSLRTTQSECGECNMRGGTVDLFFWPSTAASEVSAATASTVINGTTLYSPSAYIYLRTVYAEDSCTQVGQRYYSLFLSMNPEDISTQVHIGGKVAQSGANRYGKLDFADLTGLPPASNYEMQPDCIMFGCPTIYPNSWNPYLVVPTQLRQLDPAWKSCAAALEGLYDPPVALTAQATMVKPTKPVAYTDPTTSPYAQATMSVLEPTTTSLPVAANIPPTVAFSEVIPSATDSDPAISHSSDTPDSSSQALHREAGAMSTSPSGTGFSTRQSTDVTYASPSSKSGNPGDGIGSIVPSTNQPNHGSSSSPYFLATTEGLDGLAPPNTMQSSSHHAYAPSLSLGEHTSGTAALDGVFGIESTALASKPSASSLASPSAELKPPYTSANAYTSMAEVPVVTSLPVVTFDSISSSSVYSSVAASESAVLQTTAASSAFRRTLCWSPWWSFIIAFVLVEVP